MMSYVKLLSVIIVFVLGQSASAQNLLGERIRKITGNKSNHFIDSGIFHGGEKINSTLKGVRHSSDKTGKTERIVIDFESSNIPAVYGHVAGKNKSISIDFSRTKLGTKTGSFGKSNLVEEINFFPMDDGSLSAELRFKSNIEVEVFHLQNPGRVVLDVKQIK